MSRVLVTGGRGFVGQWLVHAALDRGDEVIVSGLHSASPESPVFPEDSGDRVSWITADMRSARDVAAMVEQANADVIVHLAGVAFPPQAEGDPAAAYDVNTLGVVRLLSAVASSAKGRGSTPVTVVIGSALQYGVHDDRDIPLREDAAQRPATAYAASKAAQEIAALQAARANGVHVVCTRSFNHSGPGQPAEYLLPSLVRRVLKLERASTSEPRVLALGNDAIRDYLHVSDVANAYLALADRGRSGEVYNVCSGVGVRVSELAAGILRRAGVDAQAKTDPALSRATDVAVLIGSPDKLMHDTGWAPRKTTTDIIDDLLAFHNAETD